MNSLDDRIKNADPAKGLSDANLSPEILAVWERAQSTLPSRTLGRRWRIAIPLIAVALVSTGAAVVAPAVLSVGEQNTVVEPDAQIPLSYRTSSGTEVSCIYRVYLGGDVRTPDERNIGAVLADTDWTGVGQDIYDHAISNPRVPQEGEVWTNDSAETRDAISFKIAVVPMLERRLPADLRGAVGEWRSTDTCEGPFR